MMAITSNSQVHDVYLNNPQLKQAVENRLEGIGQNIAQNKTMGIGGVKDDFCDQNGGIHDYDFSSVSCGSSCSCTQWTNFMRKNAAKIYLENFALSEDNTKDYSGPIQNFLSRPEDTALTNFCFRYGERPRPPICSPTKFNESPPPLYGQKLRGRTSIYT